MYEHILCYSSYCLSFSLLTTIFNGYMIYIYYNKKCMYHMMYACMMCMYNNYNVVQFDSNNNIPRLQCSTI